MVAAIVVPVIVTPEICVVNTPDTKFAVVPVVVVPVKEVNVPVVAITVTPEICVVNTPDTKFAVVPVVVTPVNEVNVPVVAETVVPVNVWPLTTPVTLIPELKNPEPRVNVFPEKTKPPEYCKLVALMVVKVPVAAVIIEALKIGIFPDAYSIVLPVRVVIVALSFVSAANNPEFPVIVAPKRRVEKTPDTKFAVVPLVVVPVKDVNPPEVKVAVVPVVVVPESTE